MNTRIHRVASRQSFTRSLSIAAVAVVAFTALELLSAQPAFAGIVCCTSSNQLDCLCDPSLACSITRNGKFYGFQVPGRTCWNTSITGSASTVKSTLSCTSISEDLILDAPDTSETPESTSLTRTGLLQCNVLGSGEPPSGHDGGGRCQLNLTYSRVGLAQCQNFTPDIILLSEDSPEVTSTRIYSAFCSDVGEGGLEVTGTLKCDKSLNAGTLPNFCQENSECTLNLGIDSSCEVFPATAGLFAGEVLRFEQTVKGENCGITSEVVSNGTLHTRYCNGGTFDGAAVDCVSPTGEIFATVPPNDTSTVAVQVDVDFFSPQTLNVTCNPNNNDVWKFTIFPNQHVRTVANIDKDNVFVGPQGGTFPDEYVRARCVNSTPSNKMGCEVAGCDPDPANKDLGTMLFNHRNPDKTVNIEVIGTLNEGDSAIVGVQKKSISGKGLK